MPLLITYPLRRFLLANIRIGVVGLPGKWSTEALADAVEAKTGYRLVIDMAQVSLNVNKCQLQYLGHNLCDLDALIVKKITARYSPNTLDRLELLRIAEKAGMRVFSGVKNMHRLIDRLSCTVTLGNAGIAMPETRVTENVETAKATLKEFGSAVFKPLFSTKARGMCVIDSSQKKHVIDKQIRKFNSLNPMMYIQKKINLPGQDLGLVFLGGEYIGSYARVGEKNAWNTTTSSGGKYAPSNPSTAIINLAGKAQALFDMDFTTVDIAESDNGPVVFEVSAFGGFRGALEGAGINAAELYVDYVLKKLTT